MAQSNINKRNLDLLRSKLDSIAVADVDIINAWLDIGDHAVKHNLDSGEWVDLLKEKGGCPAHLSFKTVQNNIISIVNLINHFGSKGAACEAITARNESEKRASYSPQVLAKLLLPASPKKNGKKPAKPSSGLSKAVKSGIITKTQADALAALGIK
jgi:hypothetical protein